MLVQDFLRVNKLSDLKENFGIEISEYQDRVVLNYNQIESYSNRFHPLVRECRALILSLPDFNVMARSFDRFFNFGEDPNSNSFPILNASVFSKEDGSLISVYWDGEKWCSASRKMAFGEGGTVRQGFQFSDIFRQCISENGNSLNDIFKHCNKEWTYVFEMVSPITRVVKSYTQYAAFLINVRNNINGIEHWKYDELSEISLQIKGNVKFPEIYKFSSFEEIISQAKELPAMDEGYVCVTEIDGKTWRLKIKNPSYLAIAHLRGDGVVSDKRAALLVYEQDHEEYLSMFPEDREYFQPLILGYERMIDEIESSWEKFKDIESQKDFALSIQNIPGKNILFQMRKKNGGPIHEHLGVMTEQAKVRLLEAYSKM